MKYTKRISGYLLTVLIIGVSFFTVSRTQDIIDWWRIRDYKPTLEIETLAQQARFNDLGKKLFYVHDPKLMDKTAFVSSCDLGEETIVLGCYISHAGIFVYNVEDDRLQGIEEVTAAHEMLHAAYDRLSQKEIDNLSVLLNAAYAELEDERIRANVASYERRDPSIVLNELHSILGTEVRDLPKDLEEYYKKYFSDRLAVVSLAERYAEEFASREKQIEDFDIQLGDLNGEISRLQATLAEQAQQLDRDRKSITSLQEDAALYNNAVSVYNRAVRTYNGDIEQLKTLINTYNDLVSKRNEIAIEERELVDAIDTRQSEL